VYLAAEQGRVLRDADLHFVTHGLGMTVATVPGGHLFPFEYPLRTAAAIRHAIGMMACGAHETCSAGL